MTEHTLKQWPMDDMDPDERLTFEDLLRMLTAVEEAEQDDEEPR